MENLTREEWNQLSGLIARARGGSRDDDVPKRVPRRTKKTENHVEIVEPELLSQPRNRSGLSRKPATKGYAAWKSQREQPDEAGLSQPDPAPIRKSQARPKPTFNGSSFDLPKDGTKSAKKIFQTTIMKEAYKLVQDHPELKGKQGAKLRLNICTKAMKAFEPVYKDPNFMFFIQDPDSCRDLIQDFAAELENQLG